MSDNIEEMRRLDARMGHLVTVRRVANWLGNIGMVAALIDLLVMPRTSALFFRVTFPVFVLGGLLMLGASIVASFTVRRMYQIAEEWRKR